MIAKRAVLYARVSSDDRGNEGRNLTGQIQMCREYAQRKGYVIVAELAEDDKGASGAEFDLPKLNEFLGMARRSEFDVLVVREIDRLSRSLPKQLFIEDALKKTGICIEYVMGEYPDTPEGNFMKNVRAAVAELERLKIKERAMRGRIQAVKSGSVLAYNRPPYGYDLVEEGGKYRLEIREDEAEIVRRIFDWFVNGDEDGNALTLADIAQRLTEMGVPTYSDTRFRGQVNRRVIRHGRWHKATVQKLLKKEEYVGTWRWGKRRKVGAKSIPTEKQDQIGVPVPPIVDKAVWRDAQARLGKNRLQAQRNRKHRYLLAGHIRCGGCGSAVNGTYRRRKTSTYHYYVCGSIKTSAMYQHKCISPYFRGEPVDDAVWQWVKSLLTDPEILALGLRAQYDDGKDRDASLREKLERIPKQIASCQNQQEKLLDLYLSNKIPMGTWDERNAALQKQLAELSNEKARLEAELETQQLTDARIRDVQDFALRIANSINLVEENYEVKRRIIDLLDVTVRLEVDEDGKRYAETTCLLRDDTLTVESPAIRLPHQARRLGSP